MSLDGLRAWIGVVERKLTLRTRVFLVLVAIAIGGAAAGIYLGLDAQDKAVSESDLEAVRRELAGGSAAAGTGTEVTQLESELRTLQSEVAALRSEASSAGKGAGGTEEPSGGSESPANAEGGGATAPQK